MEHVRKGWLRLITAAEPKYKVGDVLALSDGVKGTVLSVNPYDGGERTYNLKTPGGFAVKKRESDLKPWVAKTAAGEITEDMKREISYRLGNAIEMEVVDSNRAGIPIATFDSIARDRFRRVGAGAVGASWDELPAAAKALVDKLIDSEVKRWGRSITPGRRTSSLTGISGPGYHRGMTKSAADLAGHTCTVVTDADGGTCGKPATAEWTSSRGRTYYECAEHDTAPALRPSAEPETGHYPLLPATIKTFTRRPFVLVRGGVVVGYAETAASAEARAGKLGATIYATR